MKKGYKQTEVGVIPEDWEVRTLGDISLKVGSGITPTGGDANYRDAGRPFVRSQNVGLGRLLLDDLVHIGEATHESFAATELVVDDVLLNITGASIGRSAIADSRIVGGNVNQHVCIVRLDQRSATSVFVSGYILSRFGQTQIDSFQAGGNRQGLNFKQVRSITIPLPPLPEQEAIAEILTDADEWIAALEKVIEKKRLVKQGAMQELLTPPGAGQAGKRRLPGFDGEWEERRLGEIADTDPENLASTTHLDYQFNYIALEDVDRGALRTYSEQIFKTAPSRARRVLRINDVLVSTVRPNLQSHLLFKKSTRRWVCSTGFCVVRCRKDVSHPQYLFQLLFSHFVISQIDALLTGSNYPAINAGDVRALRIHVPPYAEQTAIAAVLSEMDAEIEVLEAKLAKARLMKQGMMQELLTGRVRVA